MRAKRDDSTVAGEGRLARSALDEPDRQKRFETFVTAYMEAHRNGWSLGQLAANLGELNSLKLSAMKSALKQRGILLPQLKGRNQTSPIDWERIKRLAERKGR